MRGEGCVPTIDHRAYDAVLLDMNGTFMFGHDRFSQDEDFAATYRRLGGDVLDAKAVQSLVSVCCTMLIERYEDAAWYDRFPCVRQVLQEIPGAADIDRIADVIACHELGEVSTAHQGVLRQLSKTHKLGVVSNIWSGKQRWLDHFKKHRLTDVFGAMVFSSDGPHIKPSPVLFEQAASALGVAPERCLFVGDDPLRDIAPARALGMGTLLIDPKAAPDEGCVADVSEILELL
mgnify:CR=1 FL=1